MKLLSLLAASLAVLSLSSCAITHPVFEVKKAEVPAPKLFEWTGPSIQGKPKVRINLDEQKARIFDNGEEVAWTYVATGIDGHETPRGSYSITEKKADKVSNTWGIIENADGETINSNANAFTSRVPKGGRFVGAPMPHWMRLTSGGIGMHEGYIPDPGSPASHGCIRLPGEMAARMFEELPSGTPVVIE